MFQLVRAFWWYVFPHGPTPPTPPKGPWGAHRAPPRAQGALRAPWGRTALRAALKVLFVFSCTVIYIEAISMKGVLHKESVHQTQMWAGDSFQEWPRVLQNGPERLRMFGDGPEWLTMSLNC